MADRAVLDEEGGDWKVLERLRKKYQELLQFRSSIKHYTKFNQISYKLSSVSQKGTAIATTNPIKIFGAPRNGRETKILIDICHKHAISQ